MAEVTDGEGRLTMPSPARTRARALFHRYVPAGQSIVDEVIADRRAESAEEAVAMKAEKE